MVRVPTNRPSTHPGEMLLEEFLEPLGMTQTELAKRIEVPFQRINSSCRAHPFQTKWLVCAPATS